jgi:hypothetical protein
MFRDIYIFLLKLSFKIKCMTDTEFSQLLEQCDFQQTVYACYIRYL